MKEALVLSASPRSGGACDALCAEFAAGFRSCGGDVIIAATRNFTFSPCVNCGYCEKRPGSCAFDDDAHALLTMIREVPLVCVVAPIYFYGLPAGFKALVDRAQAYWRFSERENAPAYVIMTAGRTRGKLLFSGASLTLRYFFKALNRRVKGTLRFRGLESVANISENIKTETYNFGRAAAENPVKKT